MLLRVPAVEAGAPRRVSDSRADDEEVRHGSLPVLSEWREENINAAKASEVGLDAVAGRDRIETSASAGRDDLARLEAAPELRLLVGKPQHDVQRIAERLGAIAGAARHAVDRHGNTTNYEIDATPVAPPRAGDE